MHIYIVNLHTHTHAHTHTYISIDILKKQIKKQTDVLLLTLSSIARWGYQCEIVWSNSFVYQNSFWLVNKLYPGYREVSSWRVVESQFKCLTVHVLFINFLCISFCLTFSLSLSLSLSPHTHTHTHTHRHIYIYIYSSRKTTDFWNFQKHEKSNRTSSDLFDKKTRIDTEEW